MKIIDAHSHIDYITHKHQSDVVGTVCCTTDENQWNKLKVLMQQDKNIYGAFGIHPWFVDGVIDDFEKRLAKLLVQNSKYMIGEIGLDKYKPNMKHQEDVFIRQFNLAVKLKRPVMLHCVGAWDKILNVLKKYKKYELPMVIVHAFNANEDILIKLLHHDNIMFSFNKIGVYGRNYRIEQIPINRILLETDGKADVSLVENMEIIAHIKMTENADEIIFNNMQRILNNG